MTPSRRDFLQRSAALAAVLGAPALLAACGDDDDAGESSATTGSGSSDSTATTSRELEQLTAMMPFQLSISFIADMTATSCGFMEAEGIDLDVQFAQGAPQALQQLAAGNVGVIRNGPVEMILAIVDEDAPFVSIGTVNQYTNFTLTSLPDASHALADLAGLTVGMPSLGAGAEFSFDIALRGAGVELTAVERQAVGNEASGYAALQEGLVDALFVSRSTVAQYRAIGEEPYVDMLTDVNPLLGTNLVTTTDFLEGNRELLVRYLRALHTTKLALNDEAQRLELIPCVREDDWDLPQLEEAESASRIIAAAASQWFEEGEENLLRNVGERWERGVADLVDQGLLPEGTEATDFYTNELLDEALA